MSVRSEKRFAGIGGYTCKLRQLFSRYQPVLCSFVTTSAKRNQISFLNPQIKVLGKRYNVVNGKPAVDEQTVLQANPTAVKIALKDCPRCPLPQLSVSEFIGFGIALAAVNRLAMPRVDFPADVAPAFYLVIHNTIIPHLFGTFGTTFLFLEKSVINLFDALLGIVPADLISHALPREQAHAAIINNLPC